MFLSMAAILVAFNIAKPLDEAGKEVDPLVEYTGSMLRCVVDNCRSNIAHHFTMDSHPKPFECRFIPRSLSVISSLGEL